MRTLSPDNEDRTTKAASVNVNRPQAQQAGQTLKAVALPVAWVRRFSIEDRLKVNNVKLMPSKSLCSIELSLKTFHDMEIVKKIILGHLKKCSTAACWLGMVVAVLAIIDVEVTHRSHKGNHERSERLSPYEIDALNAREITAVITKSIISLLTLLMCINVYLTYTSICKFDIARNLLPDSATIFNSNLLSYYVLESLLCLFHVPPLVDYFGVSYKLQLFVLLKLYVVARYMKEHNQFTKNKTCLFLASVTGTELSNMFLFKTFLKKMPFKVIVTTYFLNIFLGAYIIYVIEEKDSYLDSTWMVVVTMTTLGYGDVVPVTFFGRVITGMMSVLGIFLMALLISVIHETLQLSQCEKRILAHLENAEYNFEKKIAAAKLIQSYWRFYSYIKSNRESLAWKRLRQIARVKKLKNRLYTNLHRWREHKKVTGDRWYREFVTDDIAMMVTDVARAVDKIQFTLNRLGYNQLHGRRAPTQRYSSKENTIYEENKDLRTSRPELVTNPKMTSEAPPPRVFICEPQSERGGEEKHKSERGGEEKHKSERGGEEKHKSERGGEEKHKSERGGEEKHKSERGGEEKHKHTISPSCSSYENMESVPTSPPPRKEIERKLEQMEDYLDGFYTKAKTDIRDMKKLFREEILPTS